MTYDRIAENAFPEDAVDASARRRQWRSALLATAERDALIELADRCLETGETEIANEPLVGTVPICVREPVVGERTLLAEALATRAEVDHRGVRGWAIRLGDDKVATVAAAVLDAEAATERGLSAEIDELCRSVQRRLDAEDAEEWSELEPTEVRFEELS